MNQDGYIRGCPAFITTSTKGQILAETGTRVIQLSPDESREQSERILKMKIEREKEREVNIDFSPYQEFISELKDEEVWVPFVDLLELPIFSLNIRRDIDKLIGLIKVNCILNQHNRRKYVIAGKKMLVATLEDFYTILDIALPVLKPTFFNIPQRMFHLYQWILRKNEDDPKFEFITTNISKELKMAQSTVRNYCKALEEAGKLILVGKSGNANQYEILGSDEEGATSAIKLNVAPDSLNRSRESTQFYFEKALQNTYTPRAILTILDYIYTFSRNGVAGRDLVDTSPQEAETARTGGGVALVAPRLTSPQEAETSNESRCSGSASTEILKECRLCGLKSPPAILNEADVCDLCAVEDTPSLKENRPTELNDSKPKEEDTKKPKKEVYL